MTLRVLFLCEGPSDAGLAAQIERIAWSRGLDAVTTAPDLDTLRKPPGRSVEAKLRTVVSIGAAFDVVAIHRDADNAGADARYREIRAAVAAARVEAPHAAVVPVRMTEAWLLLDEHSIRRVAGNPRGRCPLDLPFPRDAERVADPKVTLSRALETASELTGRKLDVLKRRFSANRRQLLERLDPGGPVNLLPSWRRFVDDVNDAFDDVGK